MRHFYVILLIAVTVTQAKSAHAHPPYQVIDMKKAHEHPILRKPAAALTFPLGDEDKRDIDILLKRFDSEENMAGLAAPQIGIAKAIIVFAAPEDPTLKVHRLDFTQSMDKQVWINPSFESIGEDKHQDYESCFSVGDDWAGAVKRFKKIKYRAYDQNGKPVEGTAEGFLARIIQHEIDHVRGVLFIDHVQKDHLFSITAFREQRIKEAQKAKEKGCSYLSTDNAKEL